jgi:RNA polymerase sigma-70 factor (ECF subfamily)
VTDNATWIESLVDRHEAALCRYALSLCGSASLAQDAVQETFLRLCKADRAAIAGHEAQWLFTVCRSRVLDQQRKDKPMQPLTPLDTDLLKADGPSPSDTAMQREAVSLVPGLLGKLPERQAEAIRLKFQQRLSYREIASVLSVSETNVGFLIHTGLKALRTQMNNLQGART